LNLIGRWRALSRGGKSVFLIVLIVIGGALNRSPGSATPVAAIPAATNSARTAVPTAPGNPTPTAAATVEPVPAPTEDPTDSPTKAPAPESTVKPPDRSGIAAIDFSGKSSADGFLRGSRISWRVELPGVAFPDQLWIHIYDASGELVHAYAETLFDDDHGLSVRRAVFDDRPGTYLMRYELDDAVVAEGTFSITAGPVAVSPPRPDATPRPKPSDKPRNCDPSYPTLCLPSSPDLNCDDVNATDFPVRGRDPHGFDGNNDGVGCES
jgi:hypothetical protein